MDASIDMRFLDRWTESSRRQREARRFLARQASWLGEPDASALAEVVEVFERHGTPGRQAEPIPLRRPTPTIGDLVD